MNLKKRMHMRPAHAYLQTITETLHEVSKDQSRTLEGVTLTTTFKHNCGVPTTHHRKPKSISLKKQETKSGPLD